MEALLTGALVFATGFIAFYVTGMDDTATYASIVHALRRSKRGIALFCSGVLLGTLVSLGIAVVFSDILGRIPNANYFAAGVLFILSWAIYSGFLHNVVLISNKDVIKKANKVGGAHLVAVGVLAFFATGLDDTVAYSALLMGAPIEKIILMSGVVLATILDLVIVNYLTKRVKINYKVIATTVLAALGTLVGFGLI